MSRREALSRRAARLTHLTRRAYEEATVPRHRPRGSSVAEVTGEPSLLFRPATGDWFIEYDGRWYRPADEHDVGVALAELAVEIVDEARLTTVPHAGETVWVTRGDDTTVFDFHSSGGRPVQRLERGPGSTPRSVVRWLDPVHDDGWVELTAALWVTGVRDLVLEAYLPPHEGLGDKTMSVLVDDGRRRRTRTTVLHRGDPTRVQLYRGDTPAWGLRVGLHCQYPEPTTDSRELGFSLVGIEQRR